MLIPTILNSKHVISDTSGKETPNNGSYFRYSFQLFSHIDSIISRASSRINILKALGGINWEYHRKLYSLKKIHNAIPFYQFLFHPVPQRLIINDPETSSTPIFRTSRSHRLRLDDSHRSSKKPKCFLSMITFPRYVLDRIFQSSNPSQNVITSPSDFRNMKDTLKNRFFNRAVTYL